MSLSRHQRPTPTAAVPTVAFACTRLVYFGANGQIVTARSMDWKNDMGTDRASDRCSCASFYVNAIPKDENPNRALASVFSVIRNVSVPFGITTPNEPNISSTRWRSVADHQRKLIFSSPR